MTIIIVAFFFVLFIVATTLKTLKKENFITIVRTRKCICDDLHSDVEQSRNTTAAVALFALIQLLLWVAQVIVRLSYLPVHYKTCLF